MRSALTTHTVHCMTILCICSFNVFFFFLSKFNFEIKLAYLMWLTKRDTRFNTRLNSILLSLYDKNTTSTVIGHKFLPCPCHEKLSSVQYLAMKKVLVRIEQEPREGAVILAARVDTVPVSQRLYPHLVSHIQLQDH